MVGAVSLEDIRGWLISGSDDPDSFVDIKWIVIDESRKDGKLVSFRVTHERYPVALYILDLEAMEAGVSAVRLVIETGVRTIDMEPGEKLRLYRILLDGGRIPFVTFYIYGEEDEIGVAVDMDKRGLTREEFEAHMATLFIGYALLMEIDFIKDQLLTEQTKTLLSLVASWISSGMGRRQVVARLVSGGLDGEIAERLVDTVLSTTGDGRERRGREESLWI